MPSIKRYLQAVKDCFTTIEIRDSSVKTKFYGLNLNPEVLIQLQNFANYYPTFDLEQLNRLPEESLGYAYAQHMNQKGIQSLEVSIDIAKKRKSNVFALRYTATHDIFHVLLDFDTSYAGEMGVFGFAVGQNYSKFLKIVEPLILLFCCIIKPHQIRKIWECDRLGKALGKQAECLLAYRFEENWARPIDDVRAELRLTSI